MTLFYLGTGTPHWLTRTDVPLFISRTRLEKSPGVLRATLPVARGRWAMDSGGFWEVTHRGGFQFTARQYVAEVRRASEEIGGLDWAAQMDHMCEPAAIAKTGLTVRRHQELTVDNFLKLRSIAPDLPFVPSVQGFEVADYDRCADLFEREGIDLAAEPLVGLGSVCRRQATAEIGEIAALMAARGMRLHGFGVKIEGLRRYGQLLTSADSQAWSIAGRYEGNRRRLAGLGPGCLHGSTAKNEANCIKYAMAWRLGAVASIPSALNVTMELGAAGRMPEPREEAA